MAKPLKIVLITVAAVIVILLGAAALVLFGIDPNSYKPQIESAARAQGVELSISGDLGLKLLPNPSIVLGETRFESEAQGINPSTFQHANLVLSWSGLLQKKINIQEIKLQQADFHLTRLEQAAAIAAAPAATAEPIELKANGEKPLSIAVEKFEISDSRITIAETDATHTLDNVQLALADVKLDGTAFPVAIDLSYSGAALASPIRVSLRTDASINQTKGLYRLNDLDLTIDGLTPEQLVLKLTLAADDRNKSASISHLSGKLGSINVGGNLDVESYDATPSFAGRIEFSDNQLRKSIEKLRGEALQTRNDKAFSSVRLASAFSGTGSQITLDDLSLSLDGTNLNGTAAFSGTAPRQLKLSLKGNRIRVDDYLTPETEAKAAGNEQAGALLAPILGPLALLDGGTGKIDLALEEIHYGEIAVSNPTLTLDAKGKKLTITALHAGVFDGKVDLTGSIDMSTPETTIRFVPKLSAINLEQALAALAPDVSVKGRLALTLDGYTRGDSGDILLQNLVGSGQLAIENPVLANVNLEQSYCELAAMVEKTPARQEPWPKGTRLDNLQSNYHFQDGHLILDSYHTGVGNLKLRGNGVISMLEQTFNIKAITRLNGDRTSDTGCLIKSKRIRDKDIPLQCKDSFTKAGAKSCKPDPEFVNKLLQEEVIDKIREKTNLDEDSSKALEGLLKGILGGGN